jgi:hypothetical protein
VSNDCDDAKYKHLLDQIESSYVPRSFVHVLDHIRCSKRIPQGVVYAWVNECYLRQWREKIPSSTHIRTALIDTDEYIQVADGINLLTIFNKNDNKNSSKFHYDRSAPQWSVGWRSFGTSGLETNPTSGTYFTSFIMKAPKCNKYVDINGGSGGGKTQLDQLSPPPPPSSSSSDDMMRHNAWRSCNFPYIDKKMVNFTAAPYLDKAICDSDWFGFDDSSANAHFCYFSSSSPQRVWNKTKFIELDVMWINHYVTRSRKEWYEKVKRGRPNVDVFDHSASIDELVDYFSEEVDLDMIEFVQRLCSVVRDFPSTNQSSQCCTHVLLGAKGISHEFPPNVQAKLNQFCKEDEKRRTGTPLDGEGVGGGGNHHRKYEFACDYLLSPYRPSRYSSHDTICHQYLMEARLPLSDVMKIKYDSNQKEDIDHFQTCIGSCEKVVNKIQAYSNNKGNQEEASYFNNVDKTKSD